jgi:hypothetical protein
VVFAAREFAEPPEWVGAVEVALEHAFFGMDDADTLHDLSQRVLRVVMRHSKQGNLNDFLNI